MADDQGKEEPTEIRNGPAQFYGDYEVLKPIGKGKFAVVYRARKVSDDTIVALKRISVDTIDAKAREKCLKEVRLLESLDHPNIIRYIDSFISDNDLVIVYEWAAAGDLKRQLRKAQERGSGFEERVIWKYFSQICNAMQHMHDKRILHRDLKPANIFLTLDGTIKVGDLGLSRELSEHTIQAHSKVGTPLYMSPEVLKGEDGYDFKSDIWSLGCLLYELTMLKSPFKSEGQNLYSLLQKISKGEYTELPINYSEELRSLVYQMISTKPEDRPEISEVCEIAARMRLATAEQKKKNRRPSGGELSRKPSISDMSAVNDAPGPNAGGSDLDRVQQQDASKDRSPIRVDSDAKSAGGDRNDDSKSSATFVGVVPVDDRNDPFYGEQHAQQQQRYNNNNNNNNRVSSAGSSNSRDGIGLRVRDAKEDQQQSQQPRTTYYGKPPPVEPSRGNSATKKEERGYSANIRNDENGRSELDSADRKDYSTNSKYGNNGGGGGGDRMTYGAGNSSSAGNNAQAGRPHRPLSAGKRGTAGRGGSATINSTNNYTSNNNNNNNNRNGSPPSRRTFGGDSSPPDHVNTNTSSRGSKAAATGPSSASAVANGAMADTGRDWSTMNFDSGNKNSNSKFGENFTDSSEAFAAMEKLYDRLVLLGMPLEDPFTNIKVEHRTASNMSRGRLLSFHFACNLQIYDNIAGHGKGYQFMQSKRMAATAIWLCQQIGGAAATGAGNIDLDMDSPVQIAKALLKLADTVKAPIEILSQMTPSSIALGYGINVVNLLMCFADAAFQQRFEIRPLVYSEGLSGDGNAGEGGHDDDDDDAVDDEVLGESVDIVAEDADEAFHDRLNASASFVGGASTRAMVTPTIDPKLWKEETERVSNMLRQAAIMRGGIGGVGSGGGDEWVLHLNTLKTFREEMSPDYKSEAQSRNGLDAGSTDVLSPKPASAASGSSRASKLGAGGMIALTDLLKTLQSTLRQNLKSMSTAERVLNNNSSIGALSREFSSHQQKLDELSTKSNTLQTGTESLSHQLAQVEEQVEAQQEQLELATGSRVGGADGGSSQLVRLKEALQVIKKDIKNMTIATNMLSHTLLQQRQGVERERNRVSLEKQRNRRGGAMGTKKRTSGIASAADEDDDIYD